MIDGQLPPPPPPPVMVPPEVPPPRRTRSIRPWLLVLGIVVVLVGVAVTLGRTIKVSYYSVSPGPVQEVDTFVEAEGETFGQDGELLFLTVVLDEVTVLEYISATLDRKVDLQEQQSIRPSGVSREELAENNRRSMEESKQRAIFVALSELGYEATLTGDGAQVVGLVEEGPAIGILEDNDIITSIEGAPVRLSSEVVAEVATRKPGESVRFVVDRENADGVVESIEVDVVLGVHPDDDERGFIGIYVDTADLQAEFPVDVTIDSRNIGGPSAGMMYALGVMNLLTEEDLTKGYTIAGTGTIEFDGDVGPIGGVRQKVFAAQDAGASYVLVPSENYEDALTAAGDEIEVVSIDVFADALAFFEALPANPSSVAAG